MKLIKPSFSIWEQEPGLEGIYKQIEKAAKVCYKSEGNITEDSAKPFIDNVLLKRGHYSPLEHGTVYLDIPHGEAFNVLPTETCWVVDNYGKNPYSEVVLHGPHFYVTTNFRTLIENNWLDDLKYLCEPTEYHEKRICVRYTSDIHFYKDITRHRVFSWAIESTRFCNYIKSHFGSSVSFITPIWLKEEEQEEFEEDLKTIESIYFKWINKGWQPQQAAYFLIQGTKAEIIMTGFASDYNHFFDLRSEIAKTGKPHPTVVELVEPLRKEFVKRGYINEENS